MYQILKAITCLVVFVIFAGTIYADESEILDKAVDKYSQQKIFCLDINEEYQFELKDGSIRTIRLVSVEEYSDSVVGMIRKAQVKVEVNGRLLDLTCAPYIMPTEFNGLRIQADTTSKWLSIPKRVQFSVWDASDPIVDAEKFGFPIRNYLLFSHGMQAYNEVVHLGWTDGCPEGVTFYHNYGVDFAGYEGRDEIISCTGGTVIRLSLDRKFIFVVIQDDGGLIWEYGHLDSVWPEVKIGSRIEKGGKIGVLGKTGPSGNFSHLHLGNYLSGADLDSDRINRRLNLYPWLIAAYQQKYQKMLYAVARPHQTISTGEKVLFDGSNSISFGTRIVSYKWVLPDGQAVDGITAQKMFDKPGVYIAELWITDEKGRKDVDFTKLRVFTASAPEGSIPTIFMTHYPTNNIAVNQPVFFRFWLQGAEDKPFKVDFGDGTVVDDYVSYSEISHIFKSPGIYVVTTSCNIEEKLIMQKQKVVVGIR